MYRLFRLIIGRNWRSIFILFFTLFLTGTWFITMRLLTDNVSESISRETRPLFGADLKISHEWLPEKPITQTFAPYLSGTEARIAEVREFSTTLFDREGKPWLVNVIAYNRSYPQKWILETNILSPREEKNRVSVSDDLLSKYASGWVVRIDGREITLTDRIIRSSDLGFSFGGENALIILPIEFLSGSLLISSGSRLDSELFVSFSRESDALTVKERIPSEAYPDYRIRTYLDRSEQSLDIVEELTEYILLILAVVSIFALIIIRSAHDRLFATLSKTLSITEILWLTRRRQLVLFLIVYMIIIPLSLITAIWVSAFIIEWVARLPGADGFHFLSRSVLWSIWLIMILIVSALYPAWRARFGWELIVPLFLRGMICRVFPRSKEWISRDMSILVVSLVTAIVTLFYIFLDIGKSLFIWWVVILALIVLFFIIRGVYVFLFSISRGVRSSRFPLYDAIRTHVRPLTPTLPITLSLTLLSIALIVFLIFSFAFRSKLTLDMSSTANVYAINILEQDREKIEKYMAWSGELYSVIRARITRINEKTLPEHLGVEKPSGEFTREFNMTTSKVDNPVIKWKEVISADEVSLDQDFAERIGLTIWDRVTFLLSGRDITLTVANIRKSEREGFRPFFYFSLDPEAFARAPKTYFAATYASDVDLWKKWILASSWPHVTFIDIENILTIVRDISSKVLSVISLFLAWITLFAIFAIIALFGEMRGIEDIKRQLYPVFGMVPSELGRSLFFSRALIYTVSYVFALFGGGVISYMMLSSWAFLEFSFSQFFSVMWGVGAWYIVMLALSRR